MLGILGRTLGLVLALVLVGLGGAGVLAGALPEHPFGQEAAEGLARLAAWIEQHAGLSRGAASPERLSPYALPALGAGLVLIVVSLWRRRGGAARGAAEAEGSAAGAGASNALPAPAADRRTLRRIEKQAQALAKKGHPLEAAEVCFASELYDRAAAFFIQAGELVRAAEIRHDQNRFVEAAELYMQAGEHESAGSIFAAHGEPARAAECFLAAGRKSVAAEMLEKAGDFRRAGDCYAEVGFHRNAAQAYVRCQAWEKAARALEEVILEERTRTGSGQDPHREKELRKLVGQAGKLYEQAGKLERAEQVLEKGGCFVLAGEIALRLERYAKASELFLEGNEPLRAAEALQRLGEDEAAARILGEYYRDRGEDEKAADHLERAGEHQAAGDLYRKLEDYARAGACYERQGDAVQAAEMFRVAGDVARAAANFERAGHHAEAAACYAELKDSRRQAESLVRAGRLLEAGQVFRGEGLDDEAIKVLQRIDASHADFQGASALLGEIFRERKMFSLAVKKLRQAIDNTELGRENLRLFYTLATVHEANGDWREAVDLYEKILALDYHFEDVGERLERARAEVQKLPSPETSVSAPAVSSGSLAGGPPAASRYEILGELGRGGMGIVYKAKDTVLDRLVAYKVLPDTLKENPQALRNFLREAKSAAQLNHPNIVTVYDAGEHAGSYYIAMEYVDGTTLKEIVRRKGALSPNAVLHILVQMCEALAYAHDKKIVHRDVKTANTMWTRERKAKIMDFGLAKVVEEVRNHTTLVSGTPYYMSPEQTLGRNVDHRTDLYSLGVTLFELATGTLPFREGNIPYHHVHTPPPDPRELRPELPPVLASIITRCLRKDPGERYASARDILAEVRAAYAKGAPKEA